MRKIAALRCIRPESGKKKNIYPYYRRKKLICQC